MAPLLWTFGPLLVSQPYPFLFLPTVYFFLAPLLRLGTLLTKLSLLPSRRGHLPGLASSSLQFLASFESSKKIFPFLFLKARSSEVMREGLSLEQCFFLSPQSNWMIGRGLAFGFSSGARSSFFGFHFPFRPSSD